jgi:sugar lactone lactonase YvrE
MKFIKALAVVLLTITSLLVLLWFNSSLQPQSWSPNKNPHFTGTFTKNTVLDQSQLILQDVGLGPEDIVLGKNGRFYTGFEDGRIISFLLNQDGDSDIQLLTNTGGRPLGMKFDQAGNLIVADSIKGLLSVTVGGETAGEITVLVDTVNGIKMKFVDHLDIAQDGTIWFSDASQRFGHKRLAYDFVEVSATGRLLSYSPKTKETKVHISNLFFANGVALGPNDEFVLVNETGKAQIQRLWLTGNKQGQQDIFLKDLPAMPDNLTYNDKGIFWVPLINLRDPLIDGLAQYPFIRKLTGGIPVSLIKARQNYAFVIGVDLDGNVKFNLQGKSKVFAITSVIEYQNSLVLGSLQMTNAAIVALPEPH